MQLISTSSSASGRAAEPWPTTGLAHRLAISVGDAALDTALRTALVLRPEFVAANDNDAEVIVTDSLPPESDFAGRAQVLVVGSSEKPRNGETVIDSLDPALILSAAAV